MNGAAQGVSGVDAIVEERHCTSPVEEWWNSLTHGAGAVGAAFVFGIMLVWAWEQMDAWKIAGVTIHGVALTGLLASSAVYHGMPIGPWKDRLQTVDHVAIFLFIAASYTPFALVLLDGTHGAVVMALQWGMAAFGVAFKLWYGPMSMRMLGLVLYVGMGVSGAVVGWPVFFTLPAWGIAWLVIGGLAYLVGVVFYLWESLPFNHLWWHLFVLAGAGCHAIAVLGFVIAHAA